ncbi:MAG TPA: isochorismatase family cysteine hydrolase [Caulobacteraceae bacterium]|jgi:nicotinamidase-related amidase|nr:isochorismatase family cysteine hydrolase [Caulobacteraceae bacterium]
MPPPSNEPAALKGPAPGHVGLLLVDVVNPLDFPGADAIGEAALRAGEAILALRRRADALGAPVIYVNDNYGHWGSEKAQIVERCRAASPRGGKLAAMLEPRPGDYFVIKPQVSGFYATNLPVLLPKLGVSRLVLTGIAADICILFTAADAHMRDYELWIPRDAVAAESDQRADWALEIARKSLGAETADTGTLDLARWIGAADRRA